MSAANNLTLEQWQNEVPDLFDAKARCLEYIQGDVDATLQVVIKKANMAWQEFGIYFHNTLTAPSLAFLQALRSMAKSGRTLMRLR
jgi:hypothetical protein